MKIFNTENGLEKVYVQQQDLIMLSKYVSNIPKTVRDRMYKSGAEFREETKDSFVEFSNKKDIDFFRSIDWIIDYKKFNNLSQGRIKSIIKSMKSREESIIKEYTNLSAREQEHHQGLLKQHQKEQYKISSLTQILLLKQDELKVQFPEVVDSDGIKLVGDDNFAYKINASLDPNKLIISKINGKELASSDVIPKSFINCGITLVLMSRNRKDYIFIDDFTFVKDFSKDRKYIILTIDYSNVKEIKVPVKKKRHCRV